MHSTNATERNDEVRPETSVYTFYSFKGGVGRSMALANVAELLYRRGLRVLMIDFDLEAPGLERYFDVSEAATDTESILNCRGLMDLLVSYKSLRSLPALAVMPPPPPAKTPDPVGDAVAASSAKSFGGRNNFAETAPTAPSRTDATNQQNGDFHFPYPVEPLTNFIVSIYGESSNGGALSLMPAGRRSGEEFANYAKQVRTFGWEEFFNRWAGEEFFEWFRHEIKRHADIVLIDSRTGVTEMGGICSYQLADTVVLFVAPNYQNLDGSRRVARSLENPDLIKVGRKGRQLWKLFVPSRVESGEGDKLDEFKNRFLRELRDLFPRQVKFNRNDPFIELRVPYVPYYAYTEGVAVRDSTHAKAADIAAAIEKLVEAIAQLEPPRSKLRQLYDLPDEQQIDVRVEEVFARFSPEDQRIVRRVLTRTVQVGSPEEGAHTTFLRVSLYGFNREEQAVIGQMAEHGLLSLDSDAVTSGGASAGATVVRITDEHAILNWKRFKDWLDEDGDFLVWRQQTKANIEQWRANEGDPSFLLYGKALALATSWQERRGAEFNEGEVAFVSESVRHIERLKEVEAERAKQFETERQQLQSTVISAQAQYQHAQQQQQQQKRRTFIGAGLAVVLVAAVVLIAGAMIYVQRRNAAITLAEIENQKAAAMWVRQANVSVENSDLDRAITDYSRAIELAPNDPEAYVLRGNARSQQQLYNDAIADYTQAIALITFSNEALNKNDPNLITAFYKRGVARRSRGDEHDHDAALYDFGRVIELSDKDADAYYQRAMIHEESGRFAEAAYDYRRAVLYASTPAVQFNAQRELDDLVKSGSVATTALPQEGQKPAAPQTFLYYSAPADLDAAQAIAKSVRELFPDVRGVQSRDVIIDCEVRYFYSEDEANAATIRDAARRDLAARGVKRDVALRFIGDIWRHVPRGQIEVWIPPLTRNAGGGNAAGATSGATRPANKRPGQTGGMRTPSAPARTAPPTTSDYGDTPRQQQTRPRKD